jgi:hypothetical protein
MKRRNGFCAALTIALLISAQPAAWSQAGPACQVVTGGVGIGNCLSPGASCGTPPLVGACVTGKRSDSKFLCNCVDGSGGLIPTGEPGKLMTVEITGPFEASTTAAVKELNTGSKTVSNLTSFIVHADGTEQFLKVPPLAPGQTKVQFFDVPTNGPVVLGLAGASLKGVRADGVFFAADGSLENAPNDDWTQQPKTPVYIQPLVDLSGFPTTFVLGPYGASSTTPTTEVDIFNNQFSDQAYTLNVVDDSGNTTTSMPITVPHGQIGTASLPTLGDYHVTISGGNGIAADHLGWQNLTNSPRSGTKAPH